MEVAKAVRPCLIKVYKILIPVLLVFWCYLMFTLAIIVRSIKDAGEEGGSLESERVLRKRKLFEDV